MTVPPTPRRVCGLVLLFLVLPHVGRAETDAIPPWTLELGIGAHHFLSDDESEVYDLGVTTFAGASLNVGPARATELHVDLSLRNGSGPEFDADPTFDVDDASYDTLRLAVGFRVGERFTSRRSGAVRVGAGVQGTWASWKDPLGDRTSRVVPGVFVELSPRFRLTESLSAWFLVRASISAEQELGDGFAAFDHDDLDVLLGVAHDMH